MLMRDHTVPQSFDMAVQVGVRTISVFVHVEPIGFTTPIAGAQLARFGGVGDKIWLPFIVEGHCRSSRTIGK
jgi:hypothetical protein